MSLAPFSNPIVGTPFPSQTSPPQEENPPPLSNESQQQAELSIQELMHQPIVIADVVAAFQQGNFLPLIHCYKNNLIPRDFFDAMGYHPIHTAVSMNLIPVVIILIDLFQVDVNLRAKNSQTCLMIAANYGHLELLKILCDRGALVNEQEDTKFSALMYAVKQGSLPAFAYLLTQNADINIKDQNGCTLAHWAAYKNNVFMLKVLKRLGLDIHGLDDTGMTPLDRAIQSEAILAVQYLMEAGDGKKPPNLDLSAPYNDEMKMILTKKYQKTKNQKRKEMLQNYFRDHRQPMTIGFYLISWLLMMIVHVHANSVSSYSYVGNFFFIIFSLYFLGYIFFYFLKSGELVKVLGRKKGYDQLSSSLNTSIDTLDSSPHVRELNPRMNYGALNKIAQSEVIINASGGSGFFTFLHELAYLVHSENYKEIARFDQVEYCPTCLIKRPLRSHHSRLTNSCVKNFCHYSPCLGRNITRNDHHLYLILLTQQMIMLNLFIYQVWKSFSGLVNNWKIYPVEVGYRMWEEFNLFYTVVYFLGLMAWVYNAFFLIVEAYGVMRNITYYEIFNASQCKYLYKIGMERKGNLVRRFFNPYDQGKKKNIKEYVSKIFHH